MFGACEHRFTDPACLLARYLSNLLAPLWASSPMRTDPQRMAQQSTRAARRAASRAEGDDAPGAEDEEAMMSNNCFVVMLPACWLSPAGCCNALWCNAPPKTASTAAPQLQACAGMPTACRLVAVALCVADWTVENLSGVGSPACCSCPEAAAGHVLSSCTCPLASLLSMAPLCRLCCPPHPLNHAVIPSIMQS